MKTTIIPSLCEAPDATCLVRTLFILMINTVMVIQSLNPLASRFLSYGPRASPTPSIPAARDPQGKSSQEQNGVKTAIPATPSFRLKTDVFLDWLSELTIPHSWFASFYGISLLSSLFWVWQIATHGQVFMFLTQGAEGTGTVRSRTLVAMGMLILQGVRRLYECLVISKSSKARMHIAHWVMGVMFYLLIGIAVWIEGSPQLRSRPLGLEDLKFKAPGLHTFVAVLLFILASGAQHDCHAYLASLKTYVVPEHPAFHAVMCPHYLAECVLYLAIGVEAAPEGCVLNRTVLCGVAFVGVNLGVTAEGTKRWYETRFGPESVKGKWRMIPWVF